MIEILLDSCCWGACLGLLLSPFALWHVIEEDRKKQRREKAEQEFFDRENLKAREKEERAALAKSDKLLRAQTRKRYEL